MTRILLDSVYTMRNVLPKHCRCVHLDLQYDDAMSYVLDARVVITTPTGRQTAHLGDTVTVHRDRTVTITRKKTLS